MLPFRIIRRYKLPRQHVLGRGRMRNMIRIRRAVSTMLAVALLALSLVAMGSPATAGEVDWCASDPIFTVDGTTFHLTGYWPRQNLPQVIGVTYVVTVPEQATVSYSIPAWETTRATVVWNRTDSPSAKQVIAATVTVDASARFITKAELYQRGPDRTVRGTSNQPMTFAIPLQARYGNAGD